MYKQLESIQMFQYEGFPPSYWSLTIPSTNSICPPFPPIPLCSSFPLLTLVTARGVWEGVITMTTIQVQPSIREFSLLASSSLFTELKREVHLSLSLCRTALTARWIIRKPHWHTAVQLERLRPMVNVIHWRCLYPLVCAWSRSAARAPQDINGY